MHKDNEKFERLWKDKHLCGWQIAAEVGISEPQFWRWMRTPLTKEQQERILQAIDNLTRTQEEQQTGPVFRTALQILEEDSLDDEEEPEDPGSYPGIVNGADLMKRHHQWLKAEQERPKTAAHRDYFYTGGSRSVLELEAVLDRLKKENPPHCICKCYDSSLTKEGGELWQNWTTIKYYTPEGNFACFETDFCPLCGSSLPVEGPQTESNGMLKI